MKRLQSGILVVDDDRDMCQNMSDILSDLGYRVDFAHDGFSALQLLEQNGYAIALLDLRMPRMDGLTLCREMTWRHPLTVAFLITAYAEDAFRALPLPVGVHRVFLKPIHVPRLLAAIAHSCETTTPAPAGARPPAR